MDRLEYHDILYNSEQLGPYPDHLLKQVPEPTNQVPGPVGRRSEKQSVFGKSLLGEFGDETQREFDRLLKRSPIEVSPGEVFQIIRATSGIT